MAIAKRSTKVTHGIFDAAKLLLDGGAAYTEVSKYLKISTDVVAMIRKAETYEEYQTIMFEYSMKNKQRAAAIKAKETEKNVAQTTPETKAVDTNAVETKAVNPTVVRIEATHYMMEELKKTNELLTGISAKLAAIVSDLYGVNNNA